MKEAFQTKDSVYLPLGWDSTSGGGHAMLLHIDRKKRRVSIFNSGAGLEANHSGVVKSSPSLVDQGEGALPETKYQGCVTLENVASERLHSEEFFQFLIELRLRAVVEKNSQYTHIFSPDADFIYKPLASYLKGTWESSYRAEFHEALYKKRQRAGSCSAKAVANALYYALSHPASHKEGTKGECKGREIYKLIKFYLHTEALITYVAKAKEENKPLTREEADLLQEIQSNISRSVKKLKSLGLVDDEHVKELTISLRDVEAEIEKRVKAVGEGEFYESWRLKEGKKVDGANGMGVAPSTLHRDFSSSYTPSFTDSHLPSEDKQAFAEAAALTFSPAEPPAKIIAALDLLKKLPRTKEQWLEVAVAYLVQLPSPSDDKSSFWHTLPSQEIIPLLRALSGLSTLLKEHKVYGKYDNDRAFYERSVFPPEVAALQFTLYGITTCLAKRLDETLLKDFTFNHSDMLYLLRSPDCVLKKARLQKKVRETLRYFNPSYDLDLLRKRESQEEILKERDNLFIASRKWGERGVDFCSLQVTEKTIEEKALVRYFLQFLKQGTIFSKLPSGSRLKKLEYLINHRRELLPESVNLLQDVAEGNTVIAFNAYSSGNKKGGELSALLSESHGAELLILSFSASSYRSLPIHSNALVDTKLPPASKHDMEDATGQNKIMVRPSIWPKLDEEISRELEMCGVDLYSEPARALAFYSKQLNLLQKAEGRALLTAHLFLPERLLEQLEDEEGFIDSLGLFFKEALNHFYEMGDQETALFLLALLVDVKAFLREAGYQDRLLDAHAHLKKLLPKCTRAEASVQQKLFQQIVDLLAHLSEQEKGAFHVDMDKGLLLEGNTLLFSALPPYIASHSAFKALVGKKEWSYTYSGGLYTIQVKGEGAFEVKIERYEIHFYRTIQGQRCTYVNKRWPHIREQCTYWQQLEENRQAPPFVVGLLEGKERVLLELNDKQEAVKTLRLPEGLEWVEAAKLPKDLPLLEMAEVVAPRKPYIVEAYAKDGALQEFNFDRKLHFEMREGKAFSREYSGYVLTQSAAIPLLKGVPFLTLVSRTSRVKILVPHSSLQSRWSLEGGFLTKQVSLQPMESTSFVEFKLEEGRLTAAEDEGKLHLLSLAIHQGNWQEAFRRVNDLHFLKRLEEEPLKQLNTISHHLMQDEKVANAYALLLHLLVKVLKNQLKYPVDKATGGDPSEACINQETLFKVYSLFTSQRSNATIKLLDRREELFLLEEFDHLKKPSGQIEAKLLENQWKSLIGERLHFLKAGSLPLFVQSLPIAKVEKIIKLPAPYELRNLLLNSPPAPIELNALVYPDNFFEKNFFSLYQIARAEQHRERGVLQRILDLNDRNNSYIAKLKAVLKKPSSFPTVEKLEDLREKVKSISSFQEKWSKQLYQEIDRILPLLERVSNQISGTFPLFSLLRAFFARVQAQLIAAAKGVVKGVTQVTKRFKARVLSFVQRKRETKEEKQKKVGLNQTALKTTDDSFSTYFQTLLATFFTVEEKEAPLSTPLIPTDHGNPLITKRLEQENQELARLEQTKNIKRSYTLQTVEQFGELYTTLSQEATRLQSALKTEKAALLTFINQTKEPLKALHKLGKHRSLSFQELQEMSLKGDPTLLKTVCSLTDEEASRALQGVSNFLVRATRLAQMKRALQLLSQAESEKEEQKKLLLIDQTGRVLDLKRAYDPSSESIDELWFEEASRYLIREDQMKKVREVEEGGEHELLLEAPTGFGKTQNLIRRLNYKKGRDGKLVINVWPASLEMTNAKEVLEGMGSYGKAGDRLNFNRSSHFTAHSLEVLLEELLISKEKGHPISIRPESLRSLELHYLLLLNHAQEKGGMNEVLRQEISALGKILNLIRKESFATIDEEHINLDPKDKLIYTLGKPARIPDAHIAVLEELFFLLGKPEMEALIHLSTNGQSSLKDALFDQQVAPVILAHFFKKFDLPNEREAEFNAFMLGNEETSGKGDAFRLFIEKHTQREEMSLLRGVLSRLLKASFKHRTDEHFGLSRLHFATKEFAIAFAAANTPKENEGSPSQFKNPHETALKTYMTYLVKGITLTQWNKLIKLLQKEAIDECNAGVPLQQTETVQLFNKVVAGSTNVSLLELTGQESEELFTRFKKDRHLVFYYLRHIVLPQIKIYPETLINTVQNFRSSFASSLSLSATPQSAETHGPKTKLIPMEGTRALMTHFLVTKCQGSSKLHELEGKSPGELLHEAVQLQAKNPKIGALIDIGALTKGLSNQEVAKAIASSSINHGVEAVLFFDEQEGFFKLMDRKSGRIYTPESTQDLETKSSTFLDQSRSFGSDIKHAIDAVGLLLTNKEMSRAAAGQAAGRMRGLKEGQSLEVAYTEEEREEIFKEQAPSIERLMKRWIENEIEQEANKNLKSQIQQMENEVRSHLLSKMLEADPETASHLLSKSRKFFLQSEQSNPWILYSQNTAPIKSREALSMVEERLTKELDHLQLNAQEKIVLRGKLQEIRSKWETMLLPETIAPSHLSEEMEYESLEEIEIQTQVETKAHEHKEERPVDPWGKDLNVFADQWTVPERFGFKMRIKSALFKAWGNLTSFFNRITTACQRSYNAFYAKRSSRVKSLLNAVSSVVGIALSIGGLVKKILHFLLTQLYDGGKKVLTPLLNRLSKKSDKEHPPLFQIKEVLSYHLNKKWKKAVDFFHPNLLVTNNFFAEKTPFLQSPQAPFTNEQKPLFEVLIVEEVVKSGAKELKMVLIDQNDAPFFRHAFKEDQAKGSDPAVKRQRKVAIFDVGLNRVTAQGKNRFEEGELEKNPLFRELLMEAKLLNGEVTYSDEEQKLLDKKSREVGFSVMHGLFEQEILSTHPLKEVLYKKSPLKRILTRKVV